MKRIILSNNNIVVVGVFLLFSCLLCCIDVCQAQAPSGNGANQVATSGYVCVQRGPDSKVWQQTLLSTNANGDVTTNEQAYTELATGICYLNNGEYVDSVEEVDPVAGGAQAIQGRHQVQWALNANAQGGAVTVATPDGSQLNSAVFGLAYYDLATGSNAALGQLQNSTGAIVAPNQVLYANAFSNLTADILYTYTKAGLSQDILLRQSPPPPDTFGLSDESSILQIYTEFFSPPEPSTTSVTNANVVDDAYLNFGSMTMGPGEALMINPSNGPVSAGYVQKQWVTVSNRTFLIESVPYSSITKQLQQLPHASNLKSGRGSVSHLAFLDSPSTRIVQSLKNAPYMQLVMAETAKPALKIDYDLLLGSSNLVLQGDTTYLVSSLVNVTNTLTIEGGTVVKYTNVWPAQIKATNMVWLTASYRPAVFTSMNDNSVGDPVTGSTGSPSLMSAVWFLDSLSTANALLIQNARFSYAAVAFDAYENETVMFRDCQFIKCGTNVVMGASYQAIFENVLSANSYMMVSGGDDSYVGGVNMTVDYCTLFTDPNYNYEYGGMTNCIFTEDDGTISSHFTLKDSDVSTSGGGVYQTVGAASYYLVNSSTNRGGGTSSIDPVLLSDLRTLTTYPPVVTNGFLTNNCTLTPQVQRNTGVPDIGYHYAPIDYAVNIEISNATVTVLPGTVLAGYGTQSNNQYGIYLYANGMLDCEGTATSPNYFVQYNTVQEQSNTNWATTNGYALLLAPGQTDNSSANFAFTDWSVLADAGQIAGQGVVCPLALQNCQLYTGNINEAGLIMSVTNCLFQRANFTVTDRPSGNSSQTFYNNLFWEGELNVKHYNGGYYTFRDNLFNQTSNTLIGTIDYCSNNAYVTTNFGFLTPTNGDVILTNSPAYQSGALGSYYYPTNLTNLIYRGSRLASAAGLYHYTVTTNNWIEGTNIVSIGFHYIAVDANTNPLDGNGDGLPDYVKDSNGDGIYDTGDLANWLNPFNIYDQGTTLEGWSPPYVRLGYWKFNTSALTNEAGLPWSVSNNVATSASWSSNALVMTSTTSDLNYPVTSNGTNYFNCTNGSVRFWFKPLWSSGSNAPAVTFLQVGYGGTNNNFWSLGAEDQVTAIVTISNNMPVTNGYITNMILGFTTASNAFSFPHFGDGVQPFLNLRSNNWYQFCLTYTPSNVAFYTNGVLLATGYSVPTSNAIPLFDLGEGIDFWPSPAAQDGFAFGNDARLGSNSVMGWLDELETFNYPLTAQQVAAGFPTFGGNATNMLDSQYVGVSDMIQTYVYGFSQPSSNNAIPVRLGYWRFDSPLLYGEQGQVPLSFSNISQPPGWSGTALNIRDIQGFSWLTQTKKE